MFIASRKIICRSANSLYFGYTFKTFERQAAVVAYVPTEYIRCEYKPQSRHTPTLQKEWDPLRR